MERTAARLLRPMPQVLRMQIGRATGDQRAWPVEGRAFGCGTMPRVPLRALPPVTLACASGCGVPEAQSFFGAACESVCEGISGRSGFTRSMPTGSGGMAPQSCSPALSLLAGE